MNAIQRWMAWVGTVSDGRLTSRHRLALTALVAGATGAYSLLGVVNFARFRASILDLVVFDQAVRGYAGLGWPISPARGVSFGAGMDFNQLGDHFSPILALLAPLYWLYDDPRMLIVAQAFLFALAAPVLWVYTRRTLGTSSAYAVALAYLLSWPIASAVNFDFHEVAFVPLLSALMIERFTAGHRLGAALAAIGLLLVKEDMGLIVAGFGGYALTQRRCVEGLGYIVGGLSFTALARSVLIPALGGDPSRFWAYGNLGENIAQVLLRFLTEPWVVLEALIEPAVKIETMLLLLWPTLLLALCSPLVLVALPHVLVRILSDRPPWWGTDFHYSAFTVAILFCAGVDGAARLTGRFQDPGGPHARALAAGWAGAVVAVALTLVPEYSFAELLRPEFYRRGPRLVAAEQAVARVPSGVMVEAVNHAGPALTARTTVLLWQDGRLTAPWIVADTRRRAVGWRSIDRQRERIEELRHEGYRIVFRRAGWFVLHRP